MSHCMSYPPKHASPGWLLVMPEPALHQAFLGRIWKDPYREKADMRQNRTIRGKMQLRSCGAVAVPRYVSSRVLRVSYLMQWVTFKSDAHCKV